MRKKSPFVGYKGWTITNGNSSSYFTLGPSEAVADVGCLQGQWEGAEGWIIIIITTGRKRIRNRWQPCGSCFTWSMNIGNKILHQSCKEICKECSSASVFRDKPVLLQSFGGLLLYTFQSEEDMTRAPLKVEVVKILGRWNFTRNKYLFFNLSPWGLCLRLLRSVTCICSIASHKWFYYYYPESLGKYITSPRTRIWFKSLYVM